MNTTVDYLIVGQGLAGSLVAQELIDAGQSVCVVDPGHASAASKIAAGIINPITGRRFVKSWYIDELIPFAQKRYGEFSDLLNGELFYKERTIVRVLFSAGEENEWLARTSQEGWKQYVGKEEGLDEFDKYTFPGLNNVALKGAQVNMPLFISAYRTYLKETNRLLEVPFEVDLGNMGSREFQGIKYTKIIFSEGARGRLNPLWSAVEFEPAKGEVFHLSIPGLKTDKLLKHKMMMAPLGEELFWFGANYEWNAEHDEPSEIGRNFLTKRLEKMLLKYEEVGHFAATRPTIKDRRPVMGQHEQWKHCYIFNGLGTKGASLGPLMAREFVDYLIKGEAVRPEVNVKRFFASPANTAV